MKKKIIIPILVLLALVIWGVRVYHVNSGIAKAYDIKTYQIGDNIPLGNATFKVKKFSYGTIEKDHNFKFVPLMVEMQVRNTSNKDISMIKIIESKLAYGMDYYQTNIGEFDTGKLRKLPPNKTANITLTYQVKPENKGRKAKLYIDQSLYDKLVRDKYQEGKRYGIAVAWD